jgi:hypothetical protein
MELKQVKRATTDLKGIIMGQSRVDCVQADSQSVKK